MILTSLISVTICLMLSSVLVVTPINALGREICKDTTLYPLTFPPGKAEHITLCHPVGKALAAANNAALQFNVGVVEGQKAPASMKCPTGHTEDYCKGWNSVRL
ncbi:MAG: hypothetical protein WAK17_20425 [Candidatus Nitrosopolaris sp.]